MENIKKLKSIIGYDFNIDTFNNITTLLFYVPYISFIYEKGIAVVDSFYIASNKAYFLAIEYAKKVNEQGIKCEANPKDINLKSAAIRCGNSVGKNTLIYRKGYGSRFAIGSIRLYDENIQAIHSTDNIKMPCDSCNLCEKACPLNAITKNNFDRSKCMREYMLKPEKADENILKAINNRVLGCDICQSVCPINSTEKTPMPNDIKNILKIDNLYKNIKEKNLKDFAKHFGKNYSNYNCLLAMLIISAGNSKDKNFYEIIKENAFNNSERVAFAAEYALKRYLSED